MSVPQATLDQLAKMFDRAISNLQIANVGSVSNEGKAFELYALAVVLRLLRANHYQISAHNVINGELSMPGGPCRPNKNNHSYFTATKPREPKLEIWMSLQTTTLSFDLYKKQLSGPGTTVPTWPSHHHEIDVGVYLAPLQHLIRPKFSQLVFAASCKYQDASKAHVREALGLRRETALLVHPKGSLSPWFIANVPADPAIPVVLFSRDAKISGYREPIDKLGVYPRHLKFVI